MIFDKREFFFLIFKMKRKSSFTLNEKFARVSLNSTKFIRTLSFFIQKEYQEHKTTTKQLRNANTFVSQVQFLYKKKILYHYHEKVSREIKKKKNKIKSNRKDKASSPVTILFFYSKDTLKLMI